MPHSISPFVPMPCLAADLCVWIAALGQCGASQSTAYHKDYWTGIHLQFQRDAIDGEVMHFCPQSQAIYALARGSKVRHWQGRHLWYMI